LGSPSIFLEESAKMQRPPGEIWAPLKKSITSAGPVATFPFPI